MWRPTSVKSEAQRFREEVYNCNKCRGFGFSRLSPSTPFFKFPPTIGAQGEASLLFIGINPRISNTNRALHVALMTNPKVFDDLASNHYQGRKYIAINGKESYYNNHAKIAKAIFPERFFEDVAVATELFLCATKDSRGLKISRSPCADTYLRKTIRQVKPKIILPVGIQVLRYLRACFGQQKDEFSVVVEGLRSVVVPMSHPRFYPYNGWTIERTIERVRATIRKSTSLSCCVRSERMSHQSTSAVKRTSVQPVLNRINGQPVITYTFSRLCFKADEIEPLSLNDQFKIETPVGVFQMTKADFYRDFPNVVRSSSYIQGRIYHYPSVPSKARKYLVELS